MLLSAEALRLQDEMHPALCYLPQRVINTPTPVIAFRDPQAKHYQTATITGLQDTSELGISPQSSQARQSKGQRNGSHRSGEVECEVDVGN